MLLQGTTTAEVKSGYGLETESELRSLEAIARRPRAPSGHAWCRRSWARTRCRSSTAPTASGYVELLVEEMIPEVARRGLAVFADVFCEQGVFTVGESRRILAAARAHGLKLRVHADELGARAAPSWRPSWARARPTTSCSRPAAGMERAGRARAAWPPCCRRRPSTCACRRFAPARAMIEAGVPVALASDANPGGGLSPSLPVRDDGRLLRAWACRWRRPSPR